MSKKYLQVSTYFNKVRKEQKVSWRIKMDSLQPQEAYIRPRSQCTCPCDINWYNDIWKMLLAWCRSVKHVLNPGLSSCIPSAFPRQHLAHGYPGTHTRMSTIVLSSKEILEITQVPINNKMDKLWNWKITQQWK